MRKILLNLFYEICMWSLVLLTAQFIDYPNVMPKAIISVLSAVGLCVALCRLTYIVENFFRIRIERKRFGDSESGDTTRAMIDHGIG